MIKGLLERIKELRTISGAGVLTCKQALIENNLDIEKAIIWLANNVVEKVEAVAVEDEKLMLPIRRVEKWAIWDDNRKMDKQLSRSLTNLKGV